MNFKAAIFDLDGTLFDSMNLWEKIDCAFLQKRGISMPAHYGFDLRTLDFEAAARYTIDLFHLQESPESIISEWNAMAVEEYTKHVWLRPYTRSYLQKLKQSDIKLGVATGLPAELYLPCLKNNGILGLFDVLCSTEQMPQGKESSAIYQSAAGKLCTLPSQCLVFEDILPAVKSAKRAGMLVYGVYDFYAKADQAQIQKIADGYLFDFKDAPLPD